MSEKWLVRFSTNLSAENVKIGEIPDAVLCVALFFTETQLYWWEGGPLLKTPLPIYNKHKKAALVLILHQYKHPGITDTGPQSF